MTMPGRNFSSAEYRHGFNGMEKDNELKGDGNSYDFGARIYDSRVGRFLSLDPLAKSFPFWSPYLFASNGPLRFVDINGEGPGDRIKAAASFLGTPYKQQTGNKHRTANTDEALEFMDCSELVCRVLAADGITPIVQLMTTKGDLYSFVNDPKKFHKSRTPKTGDIVLWKGHTGIVESYDEKSGKVTVLHATKYKTKSGKEVNGVVREQYSLQGYYIDRKGAYFYTPLSDTDNSIEENRLENTQDWKPAAIERNKSMLADVNKHLESLNHKIDEGQTMVERILGDNSRINHLKELRSKSVQLKNKLENRISNLEKRVANGEK